MGSKKMFDEMKRYFGVDSLEEVALKLGYRRSTAATWRSRGLSNTALLKFNAIKSNDGVKEASPAYNDDRVYRIPVLNAKAAAEGEKSPEGIDAFESDATLSVDKLLMKTLPPKNLRALRPEDLAMAPLLVPDSWVIFEVGRDYDGDGLYVVKWRNVLMVKKVQLNVETGRLDIISANPAYESYSVAPEDRSVFRIVGNVVRTIV